MPTFPLRRRPAQSYHEGARAFGSDRSQGKRKHAGCDLYGAAGDQVLACEAGTVVRGLYLFYDVVYALEVRHADGRIVRYGEIARATVKEGDQVREGQVVGFVGKMVSVAQPMLHLELYSGKAAGPLTDRACAPFMRRSDLVDPTAYLDAAGEQGVVSNT